MKKALILGAVSLCLWANTEAATKAKPKTKRPPSYEAEESSLQKESSDAQGIVGMAGCGLGSMIIDKNDKWSQVASSILNGTGMQSSAISFGTSNCTEDGVVEASKEKDAYIEANYVEIRKDIANGDGEYLDGLASVYGCKNPSEFKTRVILQREELLSIPASNAVRGYEEALKSAKDKC